MKPIQLRVADLPPPVGWTIRIGPGGLLQGSFRICSTWAMALTWDEYASLPCPSCIAAAAWSLMTSIVMGGRLLGFVDMLVGIIDDYNDDSAVLFVW
jgi:hypothetical protein